MATSDGIKERRTTAKSHPVRLWKGSIQKEMSLLNELLKKTVSIITNDGRNIVGTLRGYDQAMNVILEHSHERIFSEDAGMAENPLGLYIIRGDNVAVVGELDTDVDAQRDLENIRAAPLLPISHS